MEKKNFQMEVENSEKNLREETKKKTKQKKEKQNLAG